MRLCEGGVIYSSCMFAVCSESFACVVGCLLRENLRQEG